MKGYHGSNVSDTKRVPHILCLALWFQLLQTGLIETASSQHYIQRFPIRVLGAGSTFPLQIQHAAASLRDPSCTHSSP